MRKRSRNYLFFLIMLFSLSLNAKAAQLQLSFPKIPWNYYIEWWYFNGRLLLEEGKKKIYLPFIFIIAHQQHLISFDEPAKHFFLILFINYLDDNPYAVSEYYALNSKNDNLIKYFNSDFHNFYFSMPDKGVIISKSKKSFHIKFRSSRGAEILELQATPTYVATTKYCNNLFEISKQLPLIAYNYPKIEYKGFISLNNKKYKVINGQGFFDYNAWKIGWEQIVKEWLWFFAYSDDIQSVFWAFKTSSPDNKKYNIKYFKIFDKKKKLIKDYCNNEIDINYEELENPNSSKFIINTKDSQFIFQTIKSKAYLLKRPKYVDNMLYNEMKIIYDDKSSYGFAFIEFLKSLSFYENLSNYLK